MQSVDGRLQFAPTRTLSECGVRFSEQQAAGSRQQAVGSRQWAAVSGRAVAVAVSIWRSAVLTVAADNKTARRTTYIEFNLDADLCPLPELIKYLRYV